MAFRSDRILCYDNGVFGVQGLGYAIPNVGDDVRSLNGTCVQLFNVIGANLFAIMHHTDADLTTPPTINTITRIRNLVRRGRQLLGSRMRADNKPEMESTHATPAQEPFLMYPCPYWKTRNPHLREYGRYIFSCLSEIAQHTDNRRAFDVGEHFAGVVGQYLHRIQKLVAVELLGVDPATADALDYDITDDLLLTYDPTKWFTSTEMVDTPGQFDMIPTEDDLDVLRRGIPAEFAMTFGKDWPTAGTVNTGVNATSTTGVSTSSFPAPPSP